jgi:hypothetical protein
MEPSIQIQQSQLPIGSIIDSKQYIENISISLEGLTETKGSNGSFQATYLSWAHAIRLLNQHCGNIVPAIEEPVVKYMTEGETGFVRPYLINTEKQVRTPFYYFPVMDNTFKATLLPDAVDINNSVQRGITKAIAIFTGIGLQLYYGDIPKSAGYNSHDHISKVDQKSVPATPATITIDNYLEVVVPVGKDKGKRLGDLEEKSIEWWAGKFEANEKYQDSVDFRTALDFYNQDKGLF